jgi:plastocyanin
MTQQSSRREFVRTAAALGAVGATGALAGCSGGDDDEPADDDPTDTPDDGGNGGAATVAAGPNGELVFDPEEITLSVGDTVTWEFESAGHNVSAYPDHADQVSLPEGAEPFGSDGVADDQYATLAQGETYEHTFETAGEYTYVCVPHVASGMIGTVVVEE